MFVKGEGRGGGVYGSVEAIVRECCQIPLMPLKCFKVVTSGPEVSSDVAAGPMMVVDVAVISPKKVTILLVGQVRGSPIN